MSLPISGCLACLEVFPASLGRHPEHALSGVLVAGLQQLLGLVASNVVASRSSPAALALAEGVVDVLEEDQTENDVLVLAGVHRAPKLVGCLPEHVLEAQRLGTVPRLTSHQTSPAASCMSRSGFQMCSASCTYSSWRASRSALRSFGSAWNGSALFAR